MFANWTFRSTDNTLAASTAENRCREFPFNFPHEYERHKCALFETGHSVVLRSIKRCTIKPTIRPGVFRYSFITSPICGRRSNSRHPPPPPKNTHTCDREPHTAPQPGRPHACVRGAHSRAQLSNLKKRRVQNRHVFWMHVRRHSPSRPHLVRSGAPHFQSAAARAFRQFMYGN